MKIIDGNLGRKITVHIELAFISLINVITFKKIPWVREMVHLTKEEIKSYED